MYLNKANYQSRKNARVYHDYMADFWKRGASPPLWRVALLKIGTAFRSIRRALRIQEEN